MQSYRNMHPQELKEMTLKMMQDYLDTQEDDDIINIACADT